MSQTPKKPPRSTPRTRQRALWCRSCAEGGRLTRGLCSRCYARQQHDRTAFAGLRELVLGRDGRTCQVCHRPESGEHTLAVHHRKPKISRERLLITLCPACHARVHRLLVVRRPLPLLLLELWREQHPGGAEQLALNFTQTPETLQASLPEVFSERSQGAAILVSAKRPA